MKMHRSLSGALLNLKPLNKMNSDLSAVVDAFEVAVTARNAATGSRDSQNARLATLQESIASSKAEVAGAQATLNSACRELITAVEGFIVE